MNLEYLSQRMYWEASNLDSASLALSASTSTPNSLTLSAQAFLKSCLLSHNLTYLKQTTGLQESLAPLAKQHNFYSQTSSLVWKCLGSMEEKQKYMITSEYFPAHSKQNTCRRFKSEQLESEGFIMAVLLLGQ